MQIIFRVNIYLYSELLHFELLHLFRIKGRLLLLHIFNTNVRVYIFNLTCAITC